MLRGKLKKVSGGGFEKKNKFRVCRQRKKPLAKKLGVPRAKTYSTSGRAKKLQGNAPR